MIGHHWPLQTIHNYTKATKDRERQRATERDRESQRKREKIKKRKREKKEKENKRLIRIYFNDLRPEHLYLRI